MNDLKDHTDIPTCSKVYQVPMATKCSNGNKISMATKSFNGNKKFQWKQKFQWQPTDPKDQKVQNVILVVWLHM